MIVSETPMQLGDAAAAVLYNNTSYLTTSATASPTVSQETGKDTNLLALFVAIRRDSPFAAVNLLCVLRAAVLVTVAASVFFGSRATQLPYSTAAVVVVTSFCFRSCAF